MGATFNGGRFVLPPDVYETVNMPSVASTVISVGDLLVLNAATGKVEPVSKGTAGYSDSVANIGGAFVGIALQGKLAADTSDGTPGYPGEGINIALSGIYSAQVTGAASAIGSTVVGVVGATGDNTVAIGSTAGSIIGQLLQPKVGSGTETLRVRLVGKLSALRAADSIP
jgi:hypothetical protein